MLRKLLTAIILSAGILIGQSAAADAQSFPNRRVKFVVPFPAGSGTDVVARIVANELSKRLGQSFTIENQAGGNGIPAAATVARADADGYTLLVTGSGQAILAASESGLSFNVVSDFAPVALLTSAPLILAATKTFAPNSVKELVALGKEKPGTINYASPGPSTVPTLAMELLKLRTGIEIVPVSYRGGAPAMVDVAAGVVQLYFSTFASASPFFESGKVKALGLSSAAVPDFIKDMPAIADIQPIADQGLPGFDIHLWYGVFAPANTPDDVILRLQTEIAEILKKQEVRTALLNSGFEPRYMTSAEFGRYFQDEVKLWSEAAKFQRNAAKSAP